MKVYWIIAAGLCGLVALFFALSQQYERAFLSAAVGCVIWFLGYRAQMKGLIWKEESEEKIDSDEDEEV